MILPKMALLLVFLLSLPVDAIQVVLDDGSVLKGRIQATTMDSLTLETDIFGRIAVPHERIIFTKSSENEPPQHRDETEQPAVLQDSYGSKEDSIAVTLIRESIGNTAATLFTTLDREEKARYLDRLWSRRSRLFHKYYVGYHLGHRRFTVSESYFERGSLFQRRYLTGFPSPHPDNIKEAIFYTRLALKFDPDDPILQCALGYLNLERDRIDDAQKLFLKAVTKDRRLVEARNGRALAILKMKRQKAKALTLFRETCAMDRNYVGAAYAMGMCHLAMMGKDRVGLDEYFGRVVRMDPNHHDAWFKLGVFYESLRYVDKAAESYSRQLVANPNHEKASERLARVSVQLKGDSKERLSHQKLTKLAFQKPKHYLALLAESHIERGEYLGAESAFEKYLKVISFSERRYFEDLSLIATREELEKVDAAYSSEERNRALREFWALKDPTPTTPVNERRVEHYIRTAHARRHFSDGVDEFSDYGWDRRGDLYVRFGKPDHTSSTDFLVFETDPNVAKVKNRLNAQAHNGLLEVMPAQNLGPRIGGAFGSTVEIRGIPTFPLPRRTTIFTDGVESGYKWESWIYGHLAGGFEVTFIDEIGKGFYEYAEPPPGSRYPLLWRQMSPAVVVGRIASRTPSVYEHAYGGEPLNLFVTTAGFREDGRDTRQEIYFALPVAEIAHNRTIRLERELALYNWDWRLIHTNQGRIERHLTNAPSSGDLFIDQIDERVRPGSYFYALQIRDTETGNLQIHKGRVTVPDLAGKALQISDIELAGSIGPAEGRPGPFTKGDLNVLPLPTQRLQQGQANLFFEIYNLARDEFGRTRYRLDYETSAESRVTVVAALGRLRGGGPSEVASSVSYEHSGEDISESMHVSLSLPKTDTAFIDITVRVTDLIAANQPQTERTLRVNESPQ
jgi:GWxTD domain-containing protein